MVVIIILVVAGVRCCGAGGTKASAPIKATVVVQPSVRAHAIEHIPETPIHTRRVVPAEGKDAETPPMWLDERRSVSTAVCLRERSTETPPYTWSSSKRFQDPADSLVSAMKSQSAIERAREGERERERNTKTSTVPRGPR